MRIDMRQCPRFAAVSMTGAEHGVFAPPCVERGTASAADNGHARPDRPARLPQPQFHFPAHPNRDVDNAPSVASSQHELQ